MRKALLTVCKATCGYGKKVIQQDISLSLFSGDFSGIIGSNGTGKTTLFRSITGELPLLSGSVLIDGVDIHNMTHKQIARKIAVVNQSFVSAPITVFNYVLMGRIPYFEPFRIGYNTQDKEITSKYIDMMGIAHLSDKLLCELSGGEQQMASVAMALTQEPSLLLLDEPTSHLDIGYQNLIMRIIKQLNRELSLSVLMIVHDLNMASEYCRQLFLLGDKGIVARGTPQDVLTEEHLQKVYHTDVAVASNPFSGQPTVYPYTPRPRE
ncbi:MAG: ABC transporter ATP-binding protein [Porphyromonas sp.]|nr:ABC transporter ATP-binding protein [Porphyromonas sp.]